MSNRNRQQGKQAQGSGTVPPVQATSERRDDYDALTSQFPALLDPPPAPVVSEQAAEAEQQRDSGTPVCPKCGAHLAQHDIEVCDDIGRK